MSRHHEAIFRGNSTAANATINLNPGAGTTGDHTVIFEQNTTAANAIINLNADLNSDNRPALLESFGNATGGNATINNNNPTAIVDFSPGLNENTAGSIAGAGEYILPSTKLTVGSNNLSTEVSGVIKGGGSLVKVGTGALTLLGDNTFPGGLEINNGAIVAGVPVGSSQETSSALGKGDVVVGTGSLTSTSTPPTLRTTSFRTGQPLAINVDGEYTQKSDGFLQLGIGGTKGKQYDRYADRGDAHVDGQLVINQLVGSTFRPKAEDSFAVLESGLGPPIVATRGQGQSLFGEFSKVTDNLNNNPRLRLVVDHLGNGALLTYVEVPPTTPPGTIEEDDPTVTLPPVDPEAPIPEEEVVRILEPTAEQLTALFEIPFSGANIQRFNLDDRMTQIQRGMVPAAPAPQPPITGKETVGKEQPPPPVPSTPRFGVWANGWGDWVHGNSTGSAQGYHFTTGGMSAGIDYLITDQLAVGLFGGYSHAWVNFKRSGSADVDTGRGRLYATGWWVNAAVWGGYNSYSTSRQALLGLANGSTDGYEISTFCEAGYNFHCGNLVWGPLVAMQYTDAHVSGFSENGSLVPLDVHSNSQDSLRTDVGAQAYYNWHLAKTTVIPGLKLAWEHEYRYSNLDITGSVPALNNASATFNGPNIGHDSLIIEANVGIQITPRIWATIGYDGQVARDHYDSHTVTGTFSYSF
jgi:autotransporter-associated beta strand protein